MLVQHPGDGTGDGRDDWHVLRRLVALVTWYGLLAVIVAGVVLLLAFGIPFIARLAIELFEAGWGVLDW